ncbi:MAG TPA: hypothetical protein VOA64_15615 [Candidatus Dormibacteraeota bacterium]|nr:hypothetical protein [Candidatus Dormibacteraeota bacterium]
MSPSFFPYFSFREVLVDLSLVVCLVVAWYAPQLGERTLGMAERFGTRFAQKKSLSILTIAIVPILMRVSLLGLIPVPVPAIMDEFSYLLAADTFAHGRLTNPPHAMWVFFETVHVNQHPTYMSKYPPAQGAVLALGQVIAHPWIGVLLSVSAMCAATLWMLQGWFPPKWALLGATLVVLRLGMFSYWINSYWGGAVAATGGALVMGALPRILRHQHPRDALFLGLGVAILANSRPFEGFILCLAAAAVLTTWLFSKRSPSRRVTLLRVVLPLSGVLLLTAVFLGYYNWRGTGNVFLFPYVVNDQTYLNTPSFVWQKAPPPLHYLNPQLDSVYNGWARTYWKQHTFDGTWHFVNHIKFVVIKFVYFFMWPELCVPLLALPWLLRDRKIRFLIVAWLFCFLGLLAVVWSQPHYAAPMTAILFALVVQAFRHLRRWEFGGRPVGRGLSRVAVLFAAGMVLVYMAEAFRNPYSASFVAPAGVWSSHGLRARAQIEEQLGAMSGEHLVIVRYSIGQDPGGEWVYNRADIDHAKVVWAREIPGLDLEPLMHYFKGRRVWLLEPNVSSPRLTTYPTP